MMGSASGKSDTIKMCIQAAAPRLLLMILVAFGLLFSQDLSHVVTVVNIEVPVRVFKGDTFVGHLTMADFEIEEDGQAQKIEAVYLINKTKIDRSEETKKYSPKLSTRRFILLFELDDYVPQIAEAIDFFFAKVIDVGDNLEVVTPMKSYHLKGESLKKLSRRSISDQLTEKVKKDIRLAAMPLKSALRDLDMWLTGSPEGRSPGDLREILERIRDWKSLDEKKLLEFASALKKVEGQKNVFLFYQREAMKIPVGVDLEDLQRPVFFDAGKMKRAFADSSCAIHFLYVTITLQQRTDVTTMRPEDVEIVEQSQDIYGAFRELARATGGFSESSANPASSFKRAVEASENYYLLYYTPTNTKPDGKFRDIKVRVKGGGYRVLHRAGYVAQ